MPCKRGNGGYAALMFAFYDFETSGISPSFDQPLQFAAILADDNLEPRKKVNVHCRVSCKTDMRPTQHRKLHTGQFANYASSHSEREALGDGRTVQKSYIEPASTKSAWQSRG